MIWLVYHGPVKLPSATAGEEMKDGVDLVKIRTFHWLFILPRDKNLTKTVCRALKPLNYDQIILKNMLSLIKLSKKLKIIKCLIIY